MAFGGVALALVIAVLLIGALVRQGQPTTRNFDDDASSRDSSDSRTQSTPEMSASKSQPTSIPSSSDDKQDKLDDYDYVYEDDNIKKGGDDEDLPAAQPKSDEPPVSDAPVISKGEEDYDDYDYEPQGPTPKEDGKDEGPTSKESSTAAQQAPKHKQQPGNEADKSKSGDGEQEVKKPADDYGDYSKVDDALGTTPEYDYEGDYQDPDTAQEKQEGSGGRNRRLRLILEH